MIQLYRPIQLCPSPFIYAKRDASGNSFNLITQLFAENLADFYKLLGLLGHNGIDFIAPLNTPLFAAHDGVITKVYDPTNSSPTIGYGIWITHKEGWSTVYFHLNRIDRKVGDKVLKYDPIGLSGNTGKYTTGPHLHFGLYPANQNKANGYDGAINPIEFFSKEEIAGIFNPLTKKTMRYVVIKGEQFLLEEMGALKLAHNIGDPIELADLVKNGLTGTPEDLPTLPQGYIIYPLVRKERYTAITDSLRAEFNKLMDLTGLNK